MSLHPGHARVDFFELLKQDLETFVAEPDEEVQLLVDGVDFCAELVAEGIDLPRVKNSPTITITSVEVLDMVMVSICTSDTRVCSLGHSECISLADGSAAAGLARREVNSSDQFIQRACLPSPMFLQRFSGQGLQNFRPVSEAERPSFLVVQSFYDLRCD